MKNWILIAMLCFVFVSCQSLPANVTNDQSNVPHPEFDPSKDSAAPVLSPSSELQPLVHNDAYIYKLPWIKGVGYFVTQGAFSNYNYSHAGIYAWDFGMPNGTPVLAARPGKVIAVVDGRDWGTSCPNGNLGSCYNGNFVVIQHDDSSVAYYLHLTKGSLSVIEGSTITVGTKVGLSGSTGNTCGDNTCTSPGPHLHFQVKSNGIQSTTSPVKFKEVIDSGKLDGIAVYGATYISQNSPCSANCDPPVNPTLTNAMIGKARANTALNFHLIDQKFNLYGTDSSDPDQQWNVFKPGQFPGGGNAGWMFQRKDTNTCLNSWRPGISNGVLPNPYACAANDGDQQWVLNDKGVVNGVQEWQMQLQGTGFCLDAPTSTQLQNLIMYNCNDGVAQRWVIPAAGVAVVPPAWSVTPTQMTFTGSVGSTPPAQRFTISNSGGAGTFGSWSSDDSWLGANGFATTVAAGGNTGGNAIVTACTAVGTSTGQLKFSTGTSIAVISITRVCNAVVVTPPPISAPPAGYTFCANEVQRCAFFGEAGVVFGAGNKFTVPRNFINGVDCTVAIFGDPIPGAGKTCHVLLVPDAIPAGFSRCASENQRCAFTGVADVVYGQGSKITAPRSFTNGVDCNNATFGDPIPGPVKTCYYKANNPGGVPSGLSVNMSSGGRILVNWSEPVGAIKYRFKAQFDNAAVEIFGEPLSKGGTTLGGVATWATSPEAPDKQNKQICFAISSVNAAGQQSAFSGFVCTAYRYFTGGITIQSAGEAPMLKIGK